MRSTICAAMFIKILNLIYILFTQSNIFGNLRPAIPPPPIPSQPTLPNGQDNVRLNFPQRIASHRIAGSHVIILQLSVVLARKGEQGSA